MSRVSRCDQLSSVTRRNDARNEQPAVAVARYRSTRRSPSSRWRPCNQLQRQWRRQGMTVDASAKRTALSSNSVLRPTASMRTRSVPCVSPNAHPRGSLPSWNHGRLCACWCSAPALVNRGGGERERQRLRPAVQSLACACDGTTSSHATAGTWISVGNAPDVSMTTRASLRCRTAATEGISVESIGDMLADVEPGGATDVDDFPRARLAVFVSGGGSNMRAIHQACREGRVYGDIALVVSDKPGKAHCSAVPCRAVPCRGAGVDCLLCCCAWRLVFSADVPVGTTAPPSPPLALHPVSSLNTGTWCLLRPLVSLPRFLPPLAVAPTQAVVGGSSLWTKALMSQHTPLPRSNNSNNSSPNSSSSSSRQVARKQQRQPSLHSQRLSSYKHSGRSMCT